MIERLMVSLNDKKNATNWKYKCVRIKERVCEWCIVLDWGEAIASGINMIHMTEDDTPKDLPCDVTDRQRHGETDNLRRL